jgi:uncharacterized membrane protein (UPF0127 family)
MTTKFLLLKSPLGGTTTLQIKWCDTFFSKLRGFTFRSVLKKDEGLILVENRESAINTSIHMMFVFTDLAVFWLDANLKVVHKTIAKPWHPFYASTTPAQFVLELHPDLITTIEVGDTLQLTHAN